MTNAERGAIIREILGAKPQSGCEICGNFFSGISRWVDEAAEKLKGYEYKTFAVGTRTSGEIVRKEEGLWEEIGIEHCEPFRSESNREFGKALWLVIKKEVDESNPDILVMLELDKGSVSINVRPVYVFGYYKKLVRGIPQTKWDMYPVTVEDIIAKPFMEKLKAGGHSLHAAGREDIDARCLDGRPFVLEIERPVKRSLDLKEMADAVNRTKKVEVSGLRLSSRNEVIEVKEMRPDKEYRMLVEFDRVPDPGKLKNLSELVGPINQHTPTRVMHRRADILRKKKVKSMSWHKITGKKFEIQIRGDAGLYAKEFVNGDSGRTKPSVAEFLGVGAKVLELDVVKVYINQKNKPSKHPET